MSKLGRYFTVEEFEFSQNAVRLGIENKMPEEAFLRAAMLVKNCLDPLRLAVKRPVIVTSGYRCPRLNANTIGASLMSQHMRGEAADIIVPGYSALDLFKKITELDLPYDQLIEEGDWVHISYKYPPRKQRLHAIFVEGRPIYSHFETT